MPTTVLLHCPALDLNELKNTNKHGLVHILVNILYSGAKVDILN